MNYNQLILLSLYNLSQKRKKVDFEDLLEECWKQFPSTFLFSHHQWPDARKLDRPIRQLKEKGFLFKNNGDFRLTKRGETLIRQLRKSLRQKKLF
jgi:predicted transcriptional regulator